MRENGERKFSGIVLGGRTEYTPLPEYFVIRIGTSLFFNQMLSFNLTYFLYDENTHKQSIPS